MGTYLRFRFGPFAIYHRLGRAAAARRAARARAERAAERRDQREKEKAREFMAARRLAGMSAEEYGRHIGLSEEEIRQARNHP